MDFTYFRQPIGTDTENETGIVWCGGYFDATGYARRYRIGSPAEAYHTGADLNCNPPGHFDADRLAAVYSIGDGVVYHADKYPVWGNIIVVCYELEDTRIIFARYAHVTDEPNTVNSNKLLVRAGDVVGRGQQIARIGNADGTQPYHLHFDISPTTVLEHKPADWPKLNLARLRIDYADPKIWLRARTRPSTILTRTVEVTTESLNIRTYPSTSATIAGKLKLGMLVNIQNAAPVLANGHQWVRLVGHIVDVVDAPNRWIASDYTKEVNML